MGVRLREGVSWCLSAGRAVFLDLERDRYFCLPPKEDVEFRAWARCPDEISNVDVFERLERCGVLTRCDQVGTAISPTTVSVPVRDLSMETEGEATVLDVTRAVVAQKWAEAAIRRRPMVSTVKRLEHAHPGRPSGTTDAHADIRRVAAALASAALLVRKSDRCLPRAIAARAMCRRRQLYPLIVFGVRLEPFAAHSWAQWDNSVIVGDLEQVRMFTPILVVE